MKEARKTAGTRATITGDRLIVNEKRYTFDKIPKNGVDTAKAESQGHIRLVLILLFFALLLSSFVF